MKTSIPGLVIRDTKISDLNIIYRLGAGEAVFNSMISRWAPDSLADIFCLDGLISCTAARKKEIIGFIIGTASDNNADIHWILVKEKFRNRGIGASLLYKFKEKAKKTGAVNFFVALFPDKTETETFFYKNSMIKRESFVKLSGKL